MVVTNAGYEPTTLQHQAPQSRTAAVLVETRPPSDDGGGRQQSSARYRQTSTVMRQHVQSPSYATVHQVRQTAGPGGSSSAFQRAVVVDSAELVAEDEEQQRRRQQQETLLRRQEEEIEQLQLQLLARQNEHRQLAAAQNLASVPSRDAAERLPVARVGDADGRNTFRSSTTVTATTFATTGGAAGTEATAGDGPSRSASRTVHAGRYQSPGGGGGNFSTSLNSSGSFAQSSGGESRSSTMSADDFVVKRAEFVVGGGGRGDVMVPVMRRGGGGADTPSSAASWRRNGGTEQRFSTASSSGAHGCRIVSRDLRTNFHKIPEIRFNWSEP